MSQETFIVTIPISASPAANQFALRAPADGEGGGITIVNAYAINQATTSGTATYTLALHKWSAAATAVLSGTIAAAIGGTADHWTDDAPKEFTLNSAHQFLDAGEWAVINYAAVAGGAPTAGGAVVVQYQMGRGAA
jgi:hypothetical protein